MCECWCGCDERLEWYDYDYICEECDLGYHYDDWGW